MNAAIKNMISTDFADMPISSRLKAWEVESCFKCPIAGSCIDEVEQRKLLKKFEGTQKWDSSFEIHETLVASLDDENDLSRKIDELLERKYRRQLIEFSCLTEKEMMDQWRKIKGSSDSPGYFFAASTRPALSFNSRKEIFGDVHMAMHTCAAEAKNLNYLIEKSRKKLVESDETIRKEISARKALQKENTALRKELEKFMRLLALTETEKMRLTEKLRCLVEEIRSSDHEDQVKQLKAENARLGRLVIESERMGLELSAENRRLNREIENLIKKSEAQRSDHQNHMIGAGIAHECSQSCPYYDLCRKRVLIIGGPTRMEILYREMIEGNGGIFDYHNGDMRSGSKDLEKSVKRADVILCPVDCNSHGACTMVKKFCKKYGKPFQMLPSSGASSVFKAVFNENLTVN